MTPRVQPRAEPKKRPPIFWWAVFGAIVAAFQLYVWTKWITGPYFESVDSGPSDPPLYMKIAIIGWQAAAIPIALTFLYFMLIRPYRREKQVRTDGLLVIVFGLMFFQDPLSSFFGHWFTYNTYFVNMGSWVNEVPGWASYGEPGQQIAYPILWGGPTYVLIWMVGSLLGAWALNKAKARWPQLGTAGLIGLILFPAMMLFDFVFEGLIFMPLGFWQYAGGHLSVFPDAYHKFPLHEAVFAGAAITGVAALRYFKNDRGETFVERGVNEMKTSTPKKTAMRFLALFGACQLIIVLTYNIPYAGYIGNHSATWPEDTQSRSYFMSGICGEGTDRICPQPGIPNTRGNDSIQIDPEGNVVIPADGAAAELYGLEPGESLTVPLDTPNQPEVVPFNDGQDGPFKGPLFGSTNNDD